MYSRPLLGQFSVLFSLHTGFRADSRATNQSLQADKAKKATFQYRLLVGPASAAIKEVSVTAATTEETLSFVLFHVCPRLPNLDSVRFEVDVHRRLLCPEQAAREPQREEMYQLNRDQFLQVAKSITNWTFRHSDYSLLAPYVEANCASVRSLDISSHSSHGRRLADNPIASLARLPPCPSLSSLSLGIHYHVSTSQSSAFSTDDLRFNYSFLPSLTSLTLAISSSYSQRGVVDSSILHFASLFPALRSLRLEFEATDLEGADESFIFPRLFRLDLASPSFRETKNILQHCDLPSIQHLGLLFPTQSEGITLEDDYKDVPALTAQILRLRPTLGQIHYLTRSNSFYLAIIALRQDLADVWSEFSTVRTTSDIVVAGPRDNVNQSVNEEGLNMAVSSIQDLAEWTINRATALQQEGNGEGAMDLWNE